MTACPGPVGLISNPRSGHNRDHFEQIRARVEVCPTVCHLVTESAADIRPALKALADRNIRVLAINGGDGTSSAVLGELLESGIFPTPPLIALLPGGTANMNSGDIGVRGSLMKAVSRFCEWSESTRETGGNVHRRSLLKVVLPNDTQAFYGMFLGAGAIIQGTEYAHEQLHARGLRDDFSLALGTVRTVWGLLRRDPAFTPQAPLTLSLDGAAAQPYDSLILAVSTLRRLAFGMQPFWGSGDGAIRLTVIEQRCSRFVTTLLSILRGRPGRNAVPASGYNSYNAHQLTLAMTGQINLDGELHLVDGAVDIRASRSLEFLKL